jgi:hypothetical protein
MQAEQQGNGALGAQLAKLTDFLEYKMPLAIRDAMQGAG